MKVEEFITKHPANEESAEKVTVLKDDRRLCRQCVELLKIPKGEIVRIEKGFCESCQFSAH